MSLRKRFIWGVLLSALVASWAYYAEYLPFTGKWIASYRLEQYAKEQYPGFRRGKVYFNPCGAPYETTYTGDSGQEVELGCGFSGWIGDPNRRECWIRDSGAAEPVERWCRLTFAYVYITAGWQYDKPEDDCIVLHVTISEYDKLPRGEAAAHERLAESLLDVWNTLPETARLGITDVRMDYHCPTEEDPANTAGYYAALSVSGGVMTEAQILPMIQLEDAV